MNYAAANVRRYTPSGAFNPAGVLLTVTIGAAIMVPLAFVYCMATFHVPFIYLNFIFTYIFGAAAGSIVVIGIKRFGIRNAAVVGAMGLILFLVAYAAHWPAYVAVLLADWEYGEPYNIALIAEMALELVKNPDVLKELIVGINEQGAWTLSENSNQAVTGIMLAAIWLVEAIIVLYAAVSIPLKQVRSPYSERRSVWIKAEEMPLVIPHIENVDSFLSAASHHDYTALTTPLTASPDDPEVTDYATVTLYPDDMASYVSVNNVHIKRNKKGKNKGTDKKNVVEFMTIDSQTAANIRSKLTEADGVSSHIEE